MEKLKKLDKKISTSSLFVVVATKNYIGAIRHLDRNITAQINIAREFKKPFFMIVDSKLSKEEKKYIGEYFSKDNIIKKMEVDIKNKKTARYIAREIKRLTWEITGDSNVRIITEDSDDNIEGDKDK